LGLWISFDSIFLISFFHYSNSTMETCDHLMLNPTLRLYPMTQHQKIEKNMNATASLFISTYNVKL
jgi:hypothetical protein